MPVWTTEQTRALESSGKFTVLSAAAGSGKTTVLVERATRLLLDRDNPTSADKLLIVTFSNASAAEFRKRIEDRINVEIKQNPQDTYIQAQKIKLQNADISTIHAFCIKLARENFETLDISPDFLISDDAQSDELHQLAIDKALEYGYTLSDFKELVSFYGKSSSDRDIKEFLRRMDGFFSALPEPAVSAAQMRASYNSYTDIRLSPAYIEIAKHIQDKAHYMAKIAGRMDYLFERCDSTGYEQRIEDALLMSEKICRAADNMDYSSLAQLVELKPGTIGRVKNKSEISDIVRDPLYTTYKKLYDDIATELEYLDEDKYHYQISLTEKYVSVLFDVFSKYQRELMNIKKKRKMFEFADFEHFAVKLLQGADGQPTQLCLNLRRHYDYIMEDEYQDTSYVQDKIFTLLAKENMANLYVVGDVKQSIYGFRKASPEIIKAKRQLGTQQPELYTTLYLPHNFRSDYGIIQGVNYLFTHLMSEECGGVQYNQNEELQTLRTRDNRPAIKVNLYNSNEAQNTARLISQMIKNGYTIAENGIERAVTAGDFCILMRNKSKFKEYKEALEGLGCNAFVRDDEIVLNKREVQSIINLLRVIQNPLQEVYLTATLFGDIFEFSIDEILKIKYIDSRANLYKSLNGCDNQKAKEMLEMLRDFNYTAGVLSPDKLIDYVCRKTGYYRRIAFTTDGGEKRENIRWFIDFAKNYTASHKGADLAAFLRWTDRYIQSGKTTGNENAVAGDAVSIMTMHNSKGLEFPVCIVAGLATKFNKMDERSRFFMNTDLGVGMYSNIKFGYNNSTMNIQAIKDRINRNNADEEMRLLYVALTRAKNQLILSREYNNNSFSDRALEKVLAIAGTVPDACYLRSATTPMHWIMSALAGHQAMADRYTYAQADANMPSCFDIDLNADIEAEELVETTVETSVQITADMDKISSNLNYVYPNTARTRLPIKLSVSEIAKATPLALNKPDFIRGDRVSAAEKGTAMHRFAQHVNIINARENLQQEIEKLDKTGLIEPALLDMAAIEKFIHSKVADMILSAENVYTERNFRAPYSAVLAMKDEAYQGEEILVQGVMDCVLQNGDEITIIDYKTDYVHSMEQLKQRYAGQLRLYRHGAKGLFGTDNIKCILYSFHLDDIIEV